MSDTNQAIFISYAREDAVAADRIAEALRSHGLEVWFDQNELRGGEAWDQKIRNQIRTCSLLIPIVSAHTQGRGEGYFRREWKFAAERTHDMAAGIPFLVPVVIDDTAESAAMVPEEFMKVQWTRLPHGRTTPQFAAQVKRLLEAPRGAAPAAARSGTASRSAPSGGAEAAPLPVGRALRARLVWSAGAAAVILIGGAGWILLHRKSDNVAPSEEAARRSAPPTSEKSIAPAVDSKSLAVLPFENLSSEPDSAYFADGLHEEVLTAVGKVSALRVIGRTSVLPYADAKKRDLRAIAAKLGVASVVEGTVRRAGSRVKIAVQLVDAQTSRQLWGDSYERELTDVFAIQSAIAQEIAATLKATLTAGERAALGQQLTQNAEAYRLYLQGVSAVRGMGVPSQAGRARLESAIATFEQAAAADPAFVLPHVQLTQLYSYMFWFGELDPTPERARQSEAAAERVRRLAPASPEARLASGIVLYMCRNDWAAALAEFRAAQTGLPNQEEPIRWAANSLRRLGRWPEAAAAYARALALDPQQLIVAETLTETLTVMRRYAEAVRTTDDFMLRATSSAVLVEFRGIAQFGLDGDLAGYRRSLRAMSREMGGATRAQVWRADLFARDFAAAESYFETAGATVGGPGGVVNNPAAQYRALLAYVQGDENRTRQQAAEARRYFESRTWTNRQEAMVAAELAMSCALASDVAAARAALRRSRELFRQRPDAYVEIEARAIWGTALIVLGDREAALAELRLSVASASPFGLVPAFARLDPLWSRLKDDPRFEEILKAAKPL